MVGLNLSNLRLGSAIHVGVNGAVLDKLVFADHFTKLLVAHEVVVSPIYFAFSWLAGCVRNTESKLVTKVSVSEPVDESSLANA